jgi:pathogenesis-related protein 1
MKTTLIAVLMLLSFNAAFYSQGPSASHSAPSPCPGKSDLSASMIADLLNAHNRVREQFKLPKLTWNCKLAEYAQQWATNGQMVHREFNMYGENIFVANVPDFKASLAIDHWNTEQAYWDNRAGVCQPGRSCNHFTQMVWKRTTQVGCGINTGMTGRFHIMLVCNYDPAGNNSPGPAY